MLNFTTGFAVLVLIALLATPAAAQNAFQRQAGVLGAMSSTGSRGVGNRGTPTLRSKTVNPQRLSPYLDLLRSDNSVLGPYHSFVLPRQQIQQSIRRQASEIRNLRRTVSESPHATPSHGRTQTGRGGSFNNHLHYYQFPSSAR
ncbi:hypothetical protein LF1_35660 [Rubripirellula obstinata]|uniref:Uncharacterized protein n=2 Tax=Rubripirellula obstinata TaxID=406547 RepID=A0A5B1CNT0_9BACT|nr:hypothetical protein LF1_35660 [Rubripirellula obstinata]